MIVSPLTTLPTAPNSGSPANFNALADAWAAAVNVFGNTQLPALIALWNADIANVNAMAGLAARFTFSTTTTDADPGAGFLRLNNATQNVSTVVRLDQVDANGANLAGWINTWDDSTSTIKGFLVIKHATDPTKWLILNLTALATPAGYFNATVAVVASSAANPFANGDSVIVAFTPKGDVGNPWTGGAIANAAYTTPVDVAFSATPTFNAALSNVFCMGALTANVTATTINNAAHGQIISIRVLQDATGGRTFAVPAGAKVTGAIETLANRVSVLTLQWVGTANGVAVNRFEGSWNVVAP